MPVSGILIVLYLICGNHIISREALSNLALPLLTAIPGGAARRFRITIVMKREAEREAQTLLKGKTDMSKQQPTIFEQLRQRHLLAILIAGIFQVSAMLVVSIFSSNIEWSHFTKAILPGLFLSVVVLAVHYFGPAMFLKNLVELCQRKRGDPNDQEYIDLARKAQGELLDLPGRLAGWTALWWVFCGVVLAASMAFLPGVITFRWEILLASVLAALGGVFGYLFIFYSTKNSVREVAGELLDLDTGFHVERQSEPTRGVGRKLFSSFVSVNLAGSFILLTLFFFQAGAGERSEKIDVLKKISESWQRQGSDSLGPVDFSLVKGASEILDRDYLVVSGDGEVRFIRDRSSLSSPDHDLIKEKLRGMDGAPDREVSVRVDPSREYIFVPVRLKGGDRLLVGQEYSWSGFSGWKTEAFIVCLAFVVFTGLLVIQVVRLTSRDLLEPVAQLLTGTRLAADGDISQSFNIMSDDEIGSLAVGMKIMVNNLRDIAERVRTSYLEVDKVVNDLRTGSGEVSGRSKEQRGEIESSGEVLSGLETANREVSAQADELGGAIAQGSERIKELMVLANETATAMEELKESVLSSSSSIMEMGTSLKQVAGFSNQLMEHSEQNSSMLAEMEASISEVDKSTGESKAVSEEIITLADEGVEAVQNTIAGNGMIQESVDKALKTITELSERASSIDKILKVITDVTNQTNLLALNAGIIAAQAGEHGRGFAVVADEIKSLADRTSSSTAEISALIKDVQAGAREAVTAMTAGHQRVEEGVDRSFLAGKALEKIRESVQLSFKMVERVTQATSEQVISARTTMKNTEAINNLIAQIASSTREQAKAGDLVMESAENISEIAGSVKKKTDLQTRAAEDVREVIKGLEDLIEIFNRSHQMEQEVGERVTAAMDRIRETAQANEESVTRLNANTVMLEQQAENLASVIGLFKTR